MAGGGPQQQNNERRIEKTRIRGGGACLEGGVEEGDRIKKAWSCGRVIMRHACCYYIDASGGEA